MMNISGPRMIIEKIFLMPVIIAILIALALVVIIFGMLIRKEKKTAPVTDLPESYRTYLKEISFYNSLSEKDKTVFENRMMHFLSTTKITGVNTEINDSDKAYIAASAIIPIFGFPNWEYGNLHEVLVYPDSFNHEFQQTGNDRSILGMVGDGAYNNVMILSRNEIQQAYINQTGKGNTPIHEFVHLLDKSDGDTDGIPEFFLDKKYILPWLDLMRKEIQKILADRSDINPYGATNQAEFFAVVSEYFFERPDLLEEKHPELYQLLSQIFRQEPVI